MAAASMTAFCACTTNGQVDFNQDWQFWSDSQPTKQVVNLPHDAMQTETRSADVKEGRHNGFYPGNVYHYEKTFTADAALLQKHVTLAFEGVYRNSKVFVNGQEAGGYIGTASTGYPINFMIVHPSAVVKVMKHVLPRIFSPDQNINADAWKFDYRCYFDVFALANKVKGIYLHRGSTALA